MCAAVKDMLNNLQKEENPKVVAYFAHSSAIQLFLTSLGYAKDADDLRADNYQQMKNRKFRTSVLSPFASNLAAVKYE
jgi:multiple inositol-polyphosphate phosphatase/2,3-bisphosphoglycerate 3-phosphatase